MILWVARENDKSLYLFSEKPVFEKGCWAEKSGYGYCFTELPYDVFPEVTYENSPQKVELKLIENEQVKNIEKCFNLKNVHYMKTEN